ncbi:ABC transporter substrate-binding protein, partial [Rhodococcus sp. CX]|nr:ABC transporter substrate-binding protein [Rhodococcus sp. CX]
EAQRLLDELAAEGKPLNFTLSMYPSGRALGEAIQTQLSTLNNITVNVRTIDFAQVGQILGQMDYDVITNAVVFAGDPEPRLWFGLHGDSAGNYSGIKDPQMDAALSRALASRDEGERESAYEVVQRRLVELNPIIFYTRSAPGFVASGNVGGIRQYGMGSILPEELWINNTD